MVRCLDISGFLIFTRYSTLPIDIARISESDYVLTYHKRALDNVPRMRQEIMLKSQEACHGAYKRINRISDPEGFTAAPSMELNWRIQCFK